MTHDPTIRHGSSLYYAECDCGWGEPYASYEGAHAAAKRHGDTAGLVEQIKSLPISPRLLEALGIDLDHPPGDVAEWLKSDEAWAPVPLRVEGIGGPVAIGTEVDHAELEQGNAEMIDLVRKSKSVYVCALSEDGQIKHAAFHEGGTLTREGKPALAEVLRRAEISTAAMRRQVILRRVEDE